MPDFPKIATAANVWANATRNLTDDANHAILSDGTPFQGADVGLVKAKTDNLPASPAATGAAMTLTAGEETAIQGKIISDATPFTGAKIGNLLSAQAPIETTVAMDGLEDILFNITDVKTAEVESWIDLSPLQAGDTVVIKYYRIVKAAGTFAMYANETYSGVQSPPLVKIVGAKVYRGLKVTAQQTGGTNRSLDVQVVYKETN